MPKHLPNVDKTHDEIAKALNLTRQTIREIEEKAVAKFKSELARRGISIDDLIESKEPPKVSAYLTSVRLAHKANEN